MRWVQWTIVVKKLKLKLNTPKSESAFFTLYNAELDWKPSIITGEKFVQINHTPTFIVVAFGRSLSYRPHVKEIVRKAESKMSLIRAVANTSWGLHKKNLKKIWTAHFRSVLNYAAGGWQLWAGNSFVKKLSECRTGDLGWYLIGRWHCLLPVWSIKSKSNSMRCLIRQNIAKSRDKTLRDALRLKEFAGQDLNQRCEIWNRKLYEILRTPPYPF